MKSSNISSDNPPEISVHDRRVLRTRKHIREAYRSLLQEKAPSLITVKELAALADINRKTFYMYYSNISELESELEDALTEKLVQVFREQILETVDFDAFSFFERLNQAILEDLEVYRCLYHYDRLSRIINQAKDALIDTFFARYLQNSDIDQERYILCAEYAASGILSMYTRWFGSRLQMPLEELTKTAAELTLYGFRKFLEPQQPSFSHGRANKGE